MDEPLDLCLRTSKVSIIKNIAYQDEFKSAEHSLNAMATYGIEDNEKMVQQWLQHMPVDRRIPTEYSPYLQAKPNSTSSRSSFESSMSSDNCYKTNISVKLYNKALWQSFSQEGTEMIINRSGRLMYPRVEVTMAGLNANSLYSVGMTVIPVDDKRYKYKDNVWSPIGKSEVNHSLTPYTHPTSPARGSYWLKDNVLFGHAKLSNHLGPNKICLESMHKYMVQINVVHHNQEDHVYNFTIPGTEFIALTAYLNEKIISLKISHNPFARAFKNKKISDEDVDMHQNKKKPRRKSRKIANVYYDSTSSSGNSGMESSMNRTNSSVGAREISNVYYGSTSSSDNSGMWSSMNPTNSSVGADVSYGGQLYPSSVHSKESLHGSSSGLLKQHLYSSLEDRLRREYIERTKRGQGSAPLLCLVTSSGLYCHPFPF